MPYRDGDGFLRPGTNEVDPTKLDGDGLLTPFGPEAGGPPPDILRTVTIASSALLAVEVAVTEDVSVVTTAVATATAEVVAPVEEPPPTPPPSGPLARPSFKAPPPRPRPRTMRTRTGLRVSVRASHTAQDSRTMRAYVGLVVRSRAGLYVPEFAEHVVRTRSEFQFAVRYQGNDPATSRLESATTVAVTSRTSRTRNGYDDDLVMALLLADCL
jgi:hypothetical protein